MSEAAPGFIPEWPLPGNIRAFVTQSFGGQSEGLFASNNLGMHVGDTPALVKANRENLFRYLDKKINRPGRHLQCQWLRQIHGSKVAEVSTNESGFSSVGLQPQEADGCITESSLTACSVLTADCVPILLCDDQGVQVAAVHAGWRGLVAGILAQAVLRFRSPPEYLTAYIGPSICKSCYEVDGKVNQLLLGSLKSTDNSLVSNPKKNKLGHFLVDLAGIARLQLSDSGVEHIYGGNLCTHCDPGFYSHRYDLKSHQSAVGIQNTGRFASMIWKI